MNRLLTLLLVSSIAIVGTAACTDKKDDSSSSIDSDISSRTDARRARIARLTKVNAVARLYVGHDLASEELHGLLTKNEAAVLDALVARPDFKTRFAARVADFDKESGLVSATPRNAALDPTAPLADAFGGKKPEADKFARWLTRNLAPRVADELFATNPAFGDMTYRDALETIRKASAKGTGVSRGAVRQ